MTKMYIGPHLAADLRANGRWNPETMTTDKAEAAASKSAMKPAIDAALPPPMKPPLPNNIVVPPEANGSQEGPLSAQPDSDEDVRPNEGKAAAGAADLLRMLAPEGPWTVR